MTPEQRDEAAQEDLPQGGAGEMAIRAVVFDAYGTLFDVQSVAGVTDEAFPGYGELITQIWRLKQLEYTWLRSLMGRYEDFWVITRDSLSYTLGLVGLKPTPDIFDRIMDKYVHLDLFPDARATLSALKGQKLAILSNGSPDMLNAVVRNNGLDKILDATISIDSKRIFKPSPQAYALIVSCLGVKPDEVLFVSSIRSTSAVPRRSGSRSHGSSVSRPLQWPSSAGMGTSWDRRQCTRQCARKWMS
jgi:2-haloacid dehalogenase